jgi:hypothetical protein
MSDFRKFQNYRIDLEEIMAFSIYKSYKRESGYHDTLYLYPISRPRDLFEIYYYTGEDENLLEETIKMLDDYFEVKTDKEAKILT